MTSGFLCIARDKRLADRLAPHAFGAAPAWLWRADGSRIAWCNAAAAAAFGVEAPTALMQRTFPPDHTAARDIARLTDGLPPGGRPHLARLRGLTHALAPTGTGRPLTCSCAGVTLPDGAAGILVVAAEPAGLAMALGERVRRALTEDPDVAAMSADGRVLHAGAVFAARLPDTGMLAAAVRDGQDAIPVARGTVRLDRFGDGEGAMFIASFEPAAGDIPQAGPPSPDMLDAAERRLVQQRLPLRFVWSIDAAGRFAIEPGDFVALAGAPTALLHGRPFTEVAETLGLGPDMAMPRALAARESFDGLSIAWPTDTGADPLPVLLSGTPVLTPDGGFAGYRGFGLCRDTPRIAALVAAWRGGPERPPADQDPALTRPPEQRAALPAPAFPQPIPLVRKIPGMEAVPGRNVVHLRATAAGGGRPHLSVGERNAFQEIARALGARLAGDEAVPAAPGSDSSVPTERPDDASVSVSYPSGTGYGAATAAMPLERPEHAEAEPLLADALAVAASADSGLALAVLDRLPLAIAVFRGNGLLYGNRALLDWTGTGSVEALTQAGGLDALFAEPPGGGTDAGTPSQRTLLLRKADGGSIPVEARHFSVTAGTEPAAMLLLTRCDSQDRAAPAATPPAEPAVAETAELRAILDAAADGVLVLDGEGRVLSADAKAAALFGPATAARRPLSDLLAPESRKAALDAVQRASAGGPSRADDRRDASGSEVAGHTPQGAAVPLFMTIRCIGDDPLRLCAVFHDISRWKHAEEELTAARAAAERSSSAKSDFIAKISHEIRTPLNAIIGFSEVMMQERLGPIGNERYRGYAKDIHGSGTHMISLLNDLLDLSKIEAGKLELDFTAVDLNEVMQQCVAIMQPQASRDRIVIRTALSSVLPAVTADIRSIRQILLNLLSNSIKFTGPGGQVILSTVRAEDGGVVLRVRDTGIGMSEKDLATALEPFRQVPAAARPDAIGTGLGLPLTKALAEANEAVFHIRSTLNVGTLVEIAFPPARVHPAAT